MKKFTLTLIAALFVAVGAFAQPNPKEIHKGTNCKVDIEAGKHEVKPFVDIKKNRGSYVIPYYTPEGAYRWNFGISNQITGTPVSGNYYVTATTSYYGSADALLLSAPDLFEKDLVIFVNGDGKFTMPIQAAGSSSYGDYAIYPYDAESKTWPDEFTGTIDEFTKTLVFDSNLIMVRVLYNGDYQGYNLTPYFIPGNIEQDETVNGMMEGYSYYDDKVEKFPVQLAQKGNVVTVTNFLGKENEVNIQLNANRTFSMPSQFIYQDDNYVQWLGMLNYYAFGCTQDEFDTDDYTNLRTTMTGKGTGAELTFDEPILMYDDNLGFYYDLYSDVKIYFVNGSCERYDYSKAENASAPRFNFDQNLTGIQNAKTAEAVGVSYVDMAGRQVTAATKGVVLKTTKYADGSKKTVKVVRK